MDWFLKINKFLASWIFQIQKQKIGWKGSYSNVFNKFFQLETIVDIRRGFNHWKFVDCKDDIILFKFSRIKMRRINVVAHVEELDWDFRSGDIPWVDLRLKYFEFLGHPRSKTSKQKLSRKWEMVWVLVWTVETNT